MKTVFAVVMFHNLDSCVQGIYTGCLKKSYFCSHRNVTMRRVLRKRLELNAYKLFIVQHHHHTVTFGTQL
jgi:hypothetical protein